jgi:uncharacterized protein (TIGR00369 family)
MSAVDDQTRAACKATCDGFNSAPYYATLGMHAESDAPGTSRVTLAFSPSLLQLYGGIHGGALLSLADAAINIAVATTLGSEEAVASVEVSMQFLAPAGQNDVVATGRVTRRGKTLAFADCVLTAGGRDVGRAQGVSYVGARNKIDRRG